MKLLSITTAILSTIMLTGCETTIDTKPTTRIFTPVVAVSENVQRGVSQRPQHSERDLDLLYRTVWGEVRNQSDREIKAVVHVILNRFRSGEYGSTLGDVVKYHRDYTRCDTRRRGKGRPRCRVTRVYAFSVWNYSDRSRRLVTSDRIYDDQKFDRVRFLCNEVLNEEDFTNGANHYYHPGSMPRYKHVIRKRGKRIVKWVTRTPDWARHGYETKRRIGAGIFVRR